MIVYNSMWTLYIYICMYVCVYIIQNLRAIINFLPSKHAFGKFNLQWLYIILCELLNVYIYIYNTKPKGD